MALTPAEERRLTELEGRLREFGFPPQVVVENTSHCNLRCAHCCHRELARPRRHMARPLWDKIVEEIGREAPECEVWPTFYGEALILGRHGELWERLAHAAAAGCRNLVLNSNGTLLDRWDNIERVLDSPLRRFILSLDGFSAATFDAIRVGAHRDHVYRNVERLVERRAQRGQRYPVLICQFSRMPANAAEVEAFREYWTARGAEVKIRTMLEWTASGSVRSEAIDHASAFRIACPWANNTMAIHENGDVVACAVDYEGHFKAGNVTTQSLREVWQVLGRRLRAVHRGHRWPELPDVCRGCGDWQAAGAEYEPETAAGTRPFWVYERSAPAS